MDQAFDKMSVSYLGKSGNDYKNKILVTKLHRLVLTIDLSVAVAMNFRKK